MVRTQECMACLVSKFFIPRATPRIVTMITTQFQYCDNNYTISCENNVLVVRQYVDCNPRTTRQIDGVEGGLSIFLR